jgi:acyl-CoA carboxylase epsilon subunit
VTGQGTPDPPPLLRVVRGTPDDAELAAVVAVVASRAVPAAEPGARPLSVWAARSRMVRPPLRPGPGAWRASAWPR